MRKKEREREREREGGGGREKGREGARETKRERESQSTFYILQVAAGPTYWVHNLNKTVGKRREREQGKRERDKEICMHDWQYPKKSERARKREREREGEGGNERERQIERERERVNLPFAYLKCLQVKCTGSIYLKKTVGKRRERDRRRHMYA